MGNKGGERREEKGKMRGKGREGEGPPLLFLTNRTLHVSAGGMPTELCLLEVWLYSKSSPPWRAQSAANNGVWGGASSGVHGQSPWQRERVCHPGQTSVLPPSHNQTGNRKKHEFDDDVINNVTT